MQGNHTIKRLTNENIHDLIPLYQNAFGKSTTTEYLRKKFNTAFAGEQNLGFIAYAEDGTAAGFYGVLPCFAVFEGNKVLVAQSGHTMVHTNHRRAKLFVKLAEHTFEYCKSIGIKAVFGFPNIYSFPAFIKKLAWQHFDDYQAFHVRVRCFPWIRLKKMLPFFSRLQKLVQKLALSCYKNHIGFKNSIEAKHIVIEHDTDFWQYKTYESNIRKSLKGTKTWFKITDMFLLVGDIDGSKDLISIHNKLKTLCFWLGIPHLRYQISSGTQLYQFCINQHFQKGNTYPIAGIALDENFPIEKMKFTLADFDTF